MDHPIVFIDEECVFCSNTARRIAIRDRDHRLQFASLSGTTAQSMLSGKRFDSLVVLDDAGLHLRSEAVLRILNHLGGGHRVVARVAAWVPLALRDRLYAAVAKRRYQLAGKSCARPDERFLP